MSESFLDYFDPSVSLEDAVSDQFDRHRVGMRVRETIRSFLAVLKCRDLETYRHSLRVGIVAARIGEHVRMDPKPLLYGGLLHDIGKTLVDPGVLTKRTRFDESDYEAIRSHVMDGYRMLRGILDFTADTIVRHHSFQERGYPAVLPEPLHRYGPNGRERLDAYGKLLMTADVYDAAHRRNDRGEGVRTGDDIRCLMTKMFPDELGLIDTLYLEDIFTTRIY